MKQRCLAMSPDKRLTEWRLRRELDEKSFLFKLGVKVARLTAPIQ